MDLSPAYWRILVTRGPRVATDLLARDIRSGLFARDGLRARARDLRAHLYADIRERARTEFFPALDMGPDPLEQSTRFD